MTTQETAGQAYINVENLFLSLLEKLEANGRPRKGATFSFWLRPTAQAIINLPWGRPTFRTTVNHPSTAPPRNSCC